MTAVCSRVFLQWRTRKACAWEFDLDAIERAGRELGLRLPVGLAVVEAGGYWQTTDGAHRVKTADRGEHAHGITVRRSVDAERASRILWHELTHAAQAEAHPTGPHRFYREAYAVHSRARVGAYGGAYRANPFEVEAREAEANHERLPLARPAQKGGQS